MQISEKQLNFGKNTMLIISSTKYSNYLFIMQMLYKKFNVLKIFIHPIILLSNIIEYKEYKVYKDQTLHFWISRIPVLEMFNTLQNKAKVLQRQSSRNTFNKLNAIFIYK